MGPEQLLGAVAAEIAADRVISITSDILGGDEQDVDENRRNMIRREIEEGNIERVVDELSQEEREELNRALWDVCERNNIDPQRQRDQRRRL